MGGGSSGTSGVSPRPLRPRSERSRVPGLTDPLWLQTLTEAVPPHFTRSREKPALGPVTSRPGDAGTQCERRPEVRGADYSVAVPGGLRASRVRPLPSERNACPSAALRIPDIFSTPRAYVGLGAVGTTCGRVSCHFPS